MCTIFVGSVHNFSRSDSDNHLVKKFLFPLDAGMVSCPTWSKKLWRYLIQVLDQEKENHRLTKEELENEISNHIVNKKELEKEISSHSATKKDLEDEIEKYIAIKVELEQIGTTAEQQPNVEFVQTAHKPVETSSAKRELDEEDKSKDDLNKEKEGHDATKNKLNYETSNHKCTMNELDQEKNDNSSTKKILKLCKIMLIKTIWSTYNAQCKLRKKWRTVTRN